MRVIKIILKKKNNSIESKLYDLVGPINLALKTDMMTERRTSDDKGKRGSLKKLGSMKFWELRAFLWLIIYFITQRHFINLPAILHT